MSEAFTFTASLWRWSARRQTGDASSWCFVTVPGEVSEQVRLLAGEPRGFGSVRVHVSTGSSQWDTSVFPDGTGSGGFVLPVKKAVRSAEEVDEGDDLTVTLEVRP